MLFRRLAVAIALIVAGLASQAPEFVQQYGQRLGGAIDELRSIVARFDQEATNQSLTRDQGIARLESNPDPLAQGRGRDMQGTVARLASLERQRDAFAVAGPLSRYTVFAEDFDGPSRGRHLCGFLPRAAGDGRGSRRGGDRLRARLDRDAPDRLAGAAPATAGVHGSGASSPGPRRRVIPLSMRWD